MGRSKRAGKLKTRKLTMEQPSDPSAPHQVIYIVQAAKEKVNIKDAYNVKAATVLGIIHIIFGLISLGIEITNLVVDNLSVATGIWTSVFFHLRRSGHWRSTKREQMLGGGHLGDGHHLCCLCWHSSYPIHHPSGLKLQVQRHDSVGFWVADRNRGNDADHRHRLCLSHLQTPLLWTDQPRHRPLQPQPCQPGCGTQHNISSRSPGPPLNFGPAFAELICSTCVPRCCWSRKQLSEVL